MSLHMTDVWMFTTLQHYFPCPGWGCCDCQPVVTCMFIRCHKPIVTMSVPCWSLWATGMYVCYRAWRTPVFSQTWLIPIGPFHDRSFHFLVRILALILSPISHCASHWHRMASWQNGGINSGMRGVILSPSFSASLIVAVSLSVLHL